MAAYLPEPTLSKEQEPQIGILLLNLGTPDAPTPQAVRAYLREFLSDPRVIEIPRYLWQPLLRGLILPIRSAKSATKYAQIWTSEGSPLRVYTQRQAKLLQGYFLHASMPQVQVEYAMRYGQPSIAAGFEKLRARHCSKILIVPLYPQYAASSTASCIDAVGRMMMQLRNQPEIRIVRSFHDEPLYIDALAEQVRNHWLRNGVAEKLVMSFHGVPQRTIDRGDPYQQECHTTARLLAENLGLRKDQYLICFQSRFGRAKWIEPATQESLEMLAKEGIKHVDVICPGFVADCLETLEEINMECRAAFLKNGGKQFNYLPCLNDHPAWIHALRELCQKHMNDWLSRR